MSAPTARAQLALNVSDLDAAVAFYGALFGAEPSKRRPGYANFSLSEPPLKLVLIESDAPERLNHLGVEVGDSAQVQRATRELSEAGLATSVQDRVECCHAVQDKVWVSDPDGAPWEVYTVLADAPPATDGAAAVAACC